MPTRPSDQPDAAADQRHVGSPVVLNGLPPETSQTSPVSGVITERLSSNSTSATESIVRRSVEKAETAVLWLRRADQILLTTLLAALLLLLIAFRLKLSGWGQTEIEIINQQPREFVYRLDINTASWVEWAQLDGIGEKLARRIVQDRIDHGPFRSIADVGRVRGVGPKLIEKISMHLKCLLCESEESEQRSDNPN